MGLLHTLAFLLPALFFIFLTLFLIYKEDRSLPQVVSSPDIAHERYMEFDFGKLWVYDSDPKHNQNLPTLVFIHSIGSSTYSWRYQIEDLKKNYRVIAFDLLGFGKSEKPIDQSYNLESSTKRIITLLDALNITSCSLVGCSLGGALALWLASQYKGRFHKVIAIAPAAVTSVVPFYSLKHHLLSPLASKLVSRTLIRLALFNGGYAYSKNITPEVVENYYAPFSEANAIYCFLKTVETIKDKNIFASLKNISIPTLILWGEKDRVVRRRDIVQIANQLLSAIKIYHPTGGHHLMEDEPTWTNQQIHSFLEQ